MAFAIVGYFDKETDRFIQAIWKELADNNICDYLHNSENNPHMKFMMFSEIDLNKAKNILLELAEKHETIEIHLKNFGFFSDKNPIFFIDFSPSIKLLNLESDIRSISSSFGEQSDLNYFDENIWMPSCQLTVKSEDLNIHDVLEYLTMIPLQFNGMLERLGIIEFHPAKQIVSYKLS
ncbi:MAG: hypothetical protein KAQ68_02990 [Clostridiales bacterium]|nr:hypothetical protein [Clostridiales bacterium]